MSGIMPPSLIPTGHQAQLAWLRESEVNLNTYYQANAMRLRAAVSVLVKDAFGSAHAATIDDLTQQTMFEFLKVLRDPVRLITGDPLKYLVGIAANLLRRARREYAHHQKYLDLHSPADQDLADPANVLPEQEAKQAMHTQLEKCIEKLPPLQKEIIERQYAALQNGAAKPPEHKEIASVMSKNPVNVRNAIFHARKSIRECLDKHVGETLKRSEKRS